MIIEENKEIITEMIEKATEQLKYSYAPYSDFKVGAALLTESGNIFTGCNIENAAYSPTNCAERTAFFKAISEGEKEFVKIAIVGGMEGTEPEELCAPCGVCRQVMNEFCDIDQFEIILMDGPNNVKVLTLNELLPYGFALD